MERWSSVQLLHGPIQNIAGSPSIRNYTVKTLLTVHDFYLHRMFQKSSWKGLYPKIQRYTVSMQSTLPSMKRILYRLHQLLQLWWRRISFTVLSESESQPSNVINFYILNFWPLGPRTFFNFPRIPRAIFFFFYVVG